MTVAIITMIQMIWQMFSPWKVSSWSPYSIGVYFCALKNGTAVPTSSNKQGLFEIQKKDNWTPCGYFHLLAVHQKTCAGVVISRCTQVGKGIQVFAFRVVPRTKRERWWLQWWFEHLSTFPCALTPPIKPPEPLWPPIVRKPSSQTSAHVPLAPFRRVSRDPP